ncbi:MAG: PIN domain-containing protein [Gemmataceae bacterium]|nr:PIN domain-containing protein [Gemmataceae bacterium]
MSTAPPERGLVDTGLLVAMRRGDADAHRFAIELLRTTGIEVSELSAMTVLAGCVSPDELTRNVGFLGNCLVRRITAPISRRAYLLLTRQIPPSPLTAGDAVVAATALICKLPLYTLDPGRFAAVPGLTALRPY